MSVLECLILYGTGNLPRSDANDNVNAVANANAWG